MVSVLNYPRDDLGCKIGFVPDIPHLNSGERILRELENPSEDSCGDINNMVLKQDALVALNIAYISESIRRAGEYAGDISETVINLLVEDEIAPARAKVRK
jgi:hypothetical protein